MKTITVTILVILSLSQQGFPQSKCVHADTLNGNNTVYFSANRNGQELYSSSWANNNQKRFKYVVLDQTEFAIRFIDIPYKDPKLSNIQSNGFPVRKEIIEKELKNTQKNSTDELVIDNETLNKIQNKYNLTHDQVMACVYAATFDKENSK